MSAFKSACAPAFKGACTPVWGAIQNLAGQVKALFAAGQQGAWYDPSDMSTLFQDSGGTAPVTSGEQPVGLMLDKSGRGNHAIQPTAINRPVLSARVNLLTKTEQFEDPIWQVQPGVTKSPYFALAPDGTLTACRVTCDGSAFFYADPIIYVPITRSIWVKSNTALSYTVALERGTNMLVTPDWQRLNSSTTGEITHTFQMGKSIFDILIWHPQVELGTVATRYQRVNTATDYDTVGFPKYLAFNGVNSGMSVPNIDLSVTNKLTIIAGLRKLVDTPDAIFLESSVGASTPINTGSFYVTAPEGPGGTYKVLAHGNASNSGGGVGVFGYVAPISNVLSAALDLSVASPGQVSLRVNALNPAVTFFGNDGHNGSFQAYPLFIGSRANSSLFFNGNLYGLVVNGALLNATQIAAAEKYMNSKTGAY